MYSNIFDTHSHYDDPKFDNDREILLSKMPQNGITKIVSCGCDLKTTEINKGLSEKFDFLYFAAGFHPENLNGATLRDLSKIEEYTRHPKCVAIGEIGLDYYWMDSTKDIQKQFFYEQIELSKQLDMPIIVHDRDAHGDTLEILKQTKPRGVVHCFSGSVEMAREIIKIGMFIGMNGVATFKNARKSLEVIKEIPIERLVLETDCPYLAPHPFRGKRNDSTLIPYVAERVGEVLNMNTQDVLNITNKNAHELYRLSEK